MKLTSEQLRKMIQEELYNMTSLVEDEEPEPIRPGETSHGMSKYLDEMEMACEHGDQKACLEAEKMREYMFMMESKRKKNG